MFIQLIPQGKSLEIEIQRIEQEMHNMDLQNQVLNGKAEKDLAYLKGRFEGVKWCLNRFS